MAGQFLMIIKMVQGKSTYIGAIVK